MADVTVVFTAVDQGLSAAISGVKSAFAGVGSAISSGATHATSAISGLTAAFRGLGPAIAAIAGVGSVVAGVFKSFSEASKIEQTVFQIQQLGGGAVKTANAVHAIQDASQQTATSFAELGQKAKTLMEAGLDANQAADAVGHLQKIALLTGESFEPLADAFARIQLKQEVTLRDLMRFKAVPGVAEIAEQFRTLQLETEKADKELEHSSKVMREGFEKEAEMAREAEEEIRYAYEQQQKWNDAITSFAGKIGLAQQIFQSWASGGKFTAPGGFGGLSETTMNEMTVGLKQLENETGLTESQLRRYAEAGKITYQDLLSAAKRYHEELEKERERAETKRVHAEEMAFRQKMFDMEEDHYKRQEELLLRQRKLVDQVGEAIKKAFGDPKAMLDFFETFGGKLRILTYNINTAFANFGMPLLKALDPVLDKINREWMPALQQVAMNFGKWMSDEITEIFHALTTGDWSIIVGQLKGAFEGVLNFIKQSFPSLANELSGALGSPEVILGIDKLFKEEIPNIAKELADAFTSSPVLEAIKTLTQVLVDDLTIAIEAAIKGALKKLGDTFLSGPKTQGPLDFLFPEFVPLNKGYAPSPSSTPSTGGPAPAGEKGATESTQVQIANLLKNLPLLFTIGATP